MVIDVVLEAAATLGESPVWSASEGVLYWMDIRQHRLCRLNPVNGENRCWQVPDDIGAFALTATLQGAVVALRTGIHLLDFASGAVPLLSPPPFDPALHRFNEGACDASGRLWVGVMFDPRDPDAQDAPVAAHLHSFTLGGGLRAEPDAADLHNGIAWSADGGTFYLTHSHTRSIYAFGVDAAGHIGDRRLFATVNESDGSPDGAAVDADGGYWCALFGGGRLRRFRKDGTFDRDIALPVSQPTMCTFGGEDMATLFVTSAAENLSDAQRAREPLAGAVLSLRPGHVGVPKRLTVR